MLNLTNHFLIALPDESNNDLFANSVILITDHNDNGSVGVIVNKPLNAKLKYILQELNLFQHDINLNNNQLFIGGPINTNSEFILRYKLSNHQDKLFELTNNFNLINEAKENQEKLLISMGYSSWSSMQLESEIAQGIWLVIKTDVGLILDIDPLERYNTALKLLGINHSGYIQYNINNLACA